MATHNPAAVSKPESVSISPLLKRLAYPDHTVPKVAATEIASAFALIFEDRLSVIQTAALLTLLHSTGRDRDPEVIALCAHRMREAATTAENKPLRKVLRERGRKEGSYRGGLVSQGLNINLLEEAIMEANSCTPGSATLLEQEATRTLRSIFQPRPL